MELTQTILTPKKMKKITLSTVKSFIRKNSENLFINVNASFDGMQDCVTSVNGGFTIAKADDREWNKRNTLGVSGAWFVGSSRDYFSAYETESMTGIEVWNCCGKFILAINK
jgi:hypothetical protein